MRVKKEHLSHLFEYGYINDKLVQVLNILISIIIAVIVPAWPITVVNYIRNPAVYGLTALGTSILMTIILLITGFTAFIIPHFTPSMKTGRFKELRDERTKMLYLSIISAILLIAVLTYLLFSLTLL